MDCGAHIDEVLHTILPPAIYLQVAKKSLKDAFSTITLKLRHHVIVRFYQRYQLKLRDVRECRIKV